MRNVDNVKFVVLGEPYGKGRPKFRKVGCRTQTYTPEKTINYESLIKMEYQAQCHGQRFEKDDALGMLIIAYKPIPLSTSKKKSKLMLGKLLYPGKKPDWDNIAKVYCDALNGIAFCDDNQIVDGRVLKLYSDVPRVEVKLWRLGTNG